MIQRLARHPRRAALGVWLLLALIACFDLWRELQAEGPSLLRDWIALSGFFTLPILIALLVFIALRSVARASRAQLLQQLGG